MCKKSTGAKQNGSLQTRAQQQALAHLCLARVAPCEQMYFQKSIEGGVGWQEEVGGGAHLIYLTILQTSIRLPVHVAHWTKHTMQESFPNSPHKTIVHGVVG